MSTVVTPEARRRWLVVVGATAVLVAVLGLAPWARSTLAVGGATAPPDELVRRALGSATVPFSATGESRGGLALPDISGFGDLASLLGGTSRTRIWWNGPRRWRVDTVDLTGESDTYGLPTSVTTWDYESRRLTTVVGDPVARLPRADDLVAPAAARRLLGAVGPEDRVSALASRRVAGRDTDGVRVRPGDPRSTIDHADVWVDRETGLPLRLVVVGVSGSPALVSELSGVRIGAPDPEALTPPAPPIARRSLRTSPDLVSRIAETNFWIMPDRLAGLPASGPLLAGTTTYGTGLVRIEVLSLTPEIAGDIVRNATAAGSVGESIDGGLVLRVGSSLLNATVVQDDDGVRAYVVTGLVTPDLLDTAAADLLASPPAFRGPS